MKKEIVAVLFIITSLVYELYAFEIPVDKNYSPARDSKILALLTNAKNKEHAPIKILRLDFKKMRGYKVGGNLWDNEQWAYIIDIRNQSITKQSCSVDLNVYDLGGFLLDKYLLFAGHLQVYETKNKSDRLFIKLSYIDQIEKADLKIGCISVP